MPTIDNRPLRDRLTSRRFIITLVVALLVTLGEKFGLTLDPQELLALAGLAASYNLKDAIAKPVAPDQ